MVCYQNHVVIDGSKPNDVKLDAPNSACFPQNHGLTDAAASKQVFDFDVLVASSTFDLHVFANTNSKRNALFLQPGNPFLPDEFAVCGQKLDMLDRENFEKTPYKFDSLGGVGATSFVEKRPHERDANALVCDTKDKNIDVLFSEFPVGTVNTKNPVVSNGHDGSDDFGEMVKVEDVVGQKSLDTFVMGFNFGFASEFLCKGVEVTVLGIEQSNDKLSDTVDSCLIPREKGHKLVSQQFQGFHGDPRVSVLRKTHFTRNHEGLSSCIEFLSCSQVESM